MYKLWFYNHYIFRIQCRKPLIFQTYIIWSNRIHSLKYLRSTTLESKDIGFRKAEFVAKTQFLYTNVIFVSFGATRQTLTETLNLLKFKLFPYVPGLVPLIFSSISTFLIFISSFYNNVIYITHILCLCISIKLAVHKFK